MKNTLLIATVAFLFTHVLASAGTMKIPLEEPAASILIPNSWAPEQEDHGIQAESPDSMTTIFVEIVADEEEMDASIEGSIEWLTVDCKLNLDDATKKEGEFETEGRKWSRISWDAQSKEWGPAVVGFLFTEVGGGRVMTITYWVLKKEQTEKSLETLGKIFASVKSLE
jgi:hypothetical protein